MLSLATLLYFTPSVQPQPTYHTLPTLPYPALAHTAPSCTPLPSLSYPSYHTLAYM